MDAITLAKNAKHAFISLSKSSTKQRVSALNKLADNLEAKYATIVLANMKDLDAAKTNKLSGALTDRLLLNEKRISSMAQSVRDIAKSEEVIGVIESSHTRSDGLTISKERVPLGVITMIFESRPNVVTDCAALSLKSGNAIILKGGKEAYYSNEVLGEIIKESFDQFVPENCVQVLSSNERALVDGLLTCNEYVDLIIPRGGEKLIDYVYKTATVAVIAHFKGLCHTYVHSDADNQKAVEICLNAKVQRPGVCNAMETLIIHRDKVGEFTDQLFSDYSENGVELRAEKELVDRYSQIKALDENDFATEYLDKILSIKLVDSLEEAILHIQKYGSHHSECILTQDKQVASEFRKRVDASFIAVNASTRFNDGGELGLGAEIGISTTKFHAYGPMGARELTTTRFFVEGDGHIRA
ncbi:MAG: glutamate-5-semialdehyde dehydrogenase [Bacteriovoracaceae bacterium]|jgi:glutamate-5-semialdehyde dehydrogenase|nr:glutamate-5-semialdehyde dehydrogenase [Bacteriovoracaceae bacterium]